MKSNTAIAGPLQCSSCGACIGPDYDQKYPEFAGEQPLCSFCYGIMWENNFIQLDDYRRMLPDGRIIKAKRVLPWN
jgi:hypothetical protein